MGRERSLLDQCARGEHQSYEGSNAANVAIVARRSIPAESTFRYARSAGLLAHRDQARQNGTRAALAFGRAGVRRAARARRADDPEWSATREGLSADLRGLHEDAWRQWRTHQ